MLNLFVFKYGSSPTKTFRGYSFLRLLLGVFLPEKAVIILRFTKFLHETLGLFLGQFLSEVDKYFVIMVLLSFLS